MSQSNDQPLDSRHIVDATDASFQQDVLVASSKQLVLVDCWATWCEPCKLLAPILSELVHHYDGDFRLVKINTEFAPETAEKLGVTGLPSVFAIHDGIVMDHFQGLLEKNDIIQWIEALLTQISFNHALENESQDPAASEKVYRELCKQREDVDAVKIALARVVSTQGRHDEAYEIILALESDRGFMEPEAQQIKAMIEIGRCSVDLDVLRNQFREQPDNPGFRLQLAEGLAANKEYEEAFSIALELVRHDKSEIGDSAKQFMIRAFRALDSDSELVNRFRRKLAILMY